MATPNARDRTSMPDGVSARAASVYRAAFVVDMHDDLPSRILDDHYDPDVRHPAGFSGDAGQTDLPRLLQSGVTAEFLSAWVDAPYARMSPDGSYARVGRYLDTIHAFVRRHPDQLILGTTAADVRRAKVEGKVAIFIGVEGGHAIEKNLERLRELYGRGARYMTLTWNNGNEWAGSSVGVDGTRTAGLTSFGREVIREMNRLGMLVDISHVSDATFFDAVATSTAPVIASHSNARALNPHPRNLSDEQLRAVAKTGGVVNVNFYSRFLDPRVDLAMTAAEQTLESQSSAIRARHGANREGAVAEIETLRRSLFAKIPSTPLSVLIDHLDHIVRVAGVDHVGLGSDFDGISAVPQGMEDITMLPRIAQGLLDRGYDEADVQKILGGNMMRVMQQVLDRHAAPDR